MPIQLETSILSNSVQHLSISFHTFGNKNLATPNTIHVKLTTAAISVHLQAHTLGKNFMNGVPG